MNIKKLILVPATFILMFALVFSFSNCNDEAEETEVVSDTVSVEVVKKTREELIINRTVMTIANPDSVSDFENKHTPDISFGETDEKGLVTIHIAVGSAGIVHPSIEEHWIDYMTLFINGEEYKHIEFENVPGSNQHDFFALLKKGDTVKVELGCNLHGIWENSVKFKK